LRHIIPISGKDSLCTAIVQRRKEPNLPYEYLFCDVEMELPETYEWLDKVEDQLEISITRIGKGLEDVIREQNMLPSHQRRFCTKYGKIIPIREYIGGDEAIQYIGFRADEERVPLRPEDEITYSYPLVEVGYGIEDVYRVLTEFGLQPPSFFWQRLYDGVYSISGSATQNFIDGMKPWIRDRLFSWRSRSNCFMCFYQRLYEWIGLLEHHPDLFDRAEKLEFDWGSTESVNRLTLSKNFYWIQDTPLSHVRNRAEGIFSKRVQKLQKDLVDMRHNEGLVDPMNRTSCGIYCGK